MSWIFFKLLVIFIARSLQSEPWEWITRLSAGSHNLGTMVSFQLWSFVFTITFWFHDRVCLIAIHDSCGFCVYKSRMVESMQVKYDFLQLSHLENALFGVYLSSYFKWLTLVCVLWALIDKHKQRKLCMQLHIQNSLKKTKRNHYKFDEEHLILQWRALLIFANFKV